MPAKTTRAKSNVARATGKAGLLNKKVKFNWKIAAVIGVVLVAAVGYLFVRFSQAAAYTWTASKIGIYRGQLVQKSDGRQAVQSVANNTGVSAQHLSVFVESSVSTLDTYCFTGKTTKELTLYRINYAYSNQFWSPDLITGGSRLGSNRIQAGDFFVCAKVPGRASSEYPGISRRIVFDAYSDCIIAVYSAARAGK